MSERFRYEAETDGLIIRVSPRFLLDETEPSKLKFLWAYTIEIENGDDRAWQLLRRYWRIVDEAGRMQEVEGEGVVGQTPRLEPGETFRYTSGVPLSAPSGIMGGYFTFQADDGASRRATVPTFSLDSPYDLSDPH